ncbi:PP2C family protein-serine/threonine phosphatase [Actinoplanes sp. HUAS TT8]|uniref:PP2C family protein-serine/threonine phosphatase n=1 Tax=Actinoplanes sp. HUAS TT8 TaxID=3447453 RepID=UPI003F51EBF5
MNTDTAPAARRRRQLSYRNLVVEQRQTIRALQQTMQPARGSADIAGLRVAVRCTSAEPDLQIGGDWYLAMPLPDGDLILAVGDTTGHGLAAAGVMLRLRYAMAALAAEGDTPAGILSRLNTIACRIGTTAVASAVVARYRPATAELTWARAGHPPVLIIGRGGAEALVDGGGTLLGVTARAVYRDSTCRIGPGEQVLLHTDGLYRRGQTVEDWIDGLAERLRECGGDQLALLDGLEYGAAGDDACALLARRHP